MAKAVRRRGEHRLKGSAKRSEEDDRRFEESFRRLIESCGAKRSASLTAQEAGHRSAPGQSVPGSVSWRQCASCTAKRKLHPSAAWAERRREI